MNFNSRIKGEKKLKKNGGLTFLYARFLEKFPSFRSFSEAFYDNYDHDILVTLK